jgi:hypothetical protein
MLARIDFKKDSRVDLAGKDRLNEALFDEMKGDEDY